MVIGNIVGIIALACATHFGMTVLIRAELKVNPNPVDGFALRWKATRAPMLCFMVAVILIYAVYFRDYALTMDSFRGSGETLSTAAGKILVVAGISAPVILFDLFNYGKPGEAGQ